MSERKSGYYRVDLKDNGPFKWLPIVCFWSELSHGWFFGDKEMHLDDSAVIYDEPLFDFFECEKIELKLIDLKELGKDAN